MSDLSWFYNLHPAAQVALLRDPHGALPGDIALRLGKHGPGVYQAYWVQNGDPAHWELAADAAQTLSAIRLQLDKWWSGLSADKKAAIIENSAGDLDREHYDAVRGASREPVSDGPHAHLVVVVSDQKTGRFRLPEMIRIYVEMQAAS